MRKQKKFNVEHCTEYQKKGDVLKKVVEQIRKMKFELKIQCGGYKNYNKIIKMKMN